MILSLLFHCILYDNNGSELVETQSHETGQHLKRVAAYKEILCCKLFGTWFWRRFQRKEQKYASAEESERKKLIN